MVPPPQHRHPIGWTIVEGYGEKPAYPRDTLGVTPAPAPTSAPLAASDGDPVITYSGVVAASASSPTTVGVSETGPDW